jgi:hypothetical protein
MRNASRLVGFALLAAVGISCGDVVRQGQSPVFLTLDSLQGSSGGGAATPSSVLLSDVLRLMATPPPCSATALCPTIFNDMGTATMRIVPKDIVGLPAPTSNNEVTISRYRVTYRRADGHNTPGVDVPFPFDGAVTALVTGGGSSVSFELVRHVAKEESPLVQLVTSRTIITTFAEVTFYGTDRVGNDISVTGTIQVDFGNFGDG